MTAKGVAFLSPFWGAGTDAGLDKEMEATLGAATTTATDAIAGADTDATVGADADA